MVAHSAEQSVDWMAGCSADKMAEEKVVQMVEQLAASWVACLVGSTVEYLASNWAEPMVELRAAN